MLEQQFKWKRRPLRSHPYDSALEKRVEESIFSCKSPNIFKNTKSIDVNYLLIV